MRDNTLYYWGPCLIRQKVADSLVDKLSIEGDKLTLEEHDYSEHLSGEVEDEKRYPESICDQVLPLMKPYFDVYFNTLKTEWRPQYNYLDLSSYYIESMWINSQTKKESQPLHNHSGDLSFIVYLDIPEEISKEKYKEVKSGRPGSVFFINDTDISSLREDDVTLALKPITTVNHSPSKGDMFIFPAYLNHFVLPFYSDVTRVSVAGNISVVRNDG